MDEMMMKGKMPMRNDNGQVQQQEAEQIPVEQNDGNSAQQSGPLPMKMIDGKAGSTAQASRRCTECTGETGGGSMPGMGA